MKAENQQNYMIEWGKTSNTKDLMRQVVREILSRESLLTARKIYNRTKKNHHCPLREGAVRKYIECFWKEGMLERNEHKQYFLSSKWVEREHIRYERLKTKQILEPVNKVLVNKKTDHVEMITFSSHREFARFIRMHLNHFLSNIRENEKNTVCWVTDHTIIGLLGIEKSSATAKKMKDKKVDYYSVVSGNTPLDEFTKIMYKIIGYDKVKTGIPNKFGMNIGIYNDVAICIIRPPHVKDEIDSIYKQTADSKNAYSKIPEAIAKLSSFVDSSNIPIQVMITRNPALVRSYKNYIISFFHDRKDN